MNKKYKNSVSKKKVKTGEIQECARSLIEDMTALSPNLKFSKNHFKSNIIGQIKLFLLGFSDVISHTKRMSFSKYKYTKYFPHFCSFLMIIFNLEDLLK